MKKILILSIFVTFVTCNLFGQTETTKTKTNTSDSLNIADTTKFITSREEGVIKAEEGGDSLPSNTKNDTVKRTSNRDLFEKFNLTKKNIQETNNSKLVKKLEKINDNDNPNKELNSIKKEFEKKQKELNVDIDTIEITRKLAKKQKSEEVDLENDLDSASKNNPIDPTHFINIYQTIPKVGKARLIKNKKLQPYSVVNINSKITIDFDIDAIANDNKFYGSLTLVGKLNSREIEVSPYSLVGKDYTPIGTTSGFSTKDFASSLVGLLAEADQNKNKNKYLRNYRINDNRRILKQLNIQNIANQNRQKYLNIINNNDINQINYDDWEDKNFRDYVLIKLKNNLKAYQSLNINKLKLDEIRILNEKKENELMLTNDTLDDIYKQNILITNKIDEIYTQIEKNNSLIPEQSDSTTNIIDNLNNILYNKINILNKTKMDSIYIPRRKIEKRRDILFNQKNMLTILTTLNDSLITLFSNPIKDGKITKELFKYYYNEYYNNQNKYIDFGENKYYNMNQYNQSNYNKLKYFDNSIYNSETTDNLKNFIDNNKIDFDQYRIFGSYVDYLEKSEKESKALSLSLKKSPVLIAEIISNLKASISEMSGALKTIDSIYKYNNDKNSVIRVAIPVIENYIYNSEKLNTAIADLNKINEGYVIGEINNKNWRNNNLVPLSDKATLNTNKDLSYRSGFINSKYYFDEEEDEEEDKENGEDNYKSFNGNSVKNENSNNSSEKQIFHQGKKIELYDLINQNINGFGEFLIDKIATETGLNLYRTLKSGEIYLEKESPKEGDVLHIDLIWNRYDNQSNLKPVRIPVASFKTKTTGWNSKIMESFFLVYNINPDKNNPDLVRSVFTGAAGVSLLFGYSSDNSSYFGYKQSTRFENRYVPKGNGQGFFKSIANAIEPSFGVNVSYLNFDNKESVEIGTGLLVGLFNNSILGTLGYNLNIAPGWNGFYWGLGFSFVDIAKKIKGANP